MDKNPESRIGIKDKDSIKKHPFFDGVDWEKVLKKEYDPPELVEIEEDEDSHDKTHKGVVLFFYFKIFIFYKTKKSQRINS